MSEEQVVNTEPQANIAAVGAEAPKKSFDRNSRGGAGGKPGFKGRGGKGGGKFERVKPEFEQKMIDVRRVTRVVSGGRRFSFSVVLVIGDRKGHVGLGIGKSGDTSAAIDKAYKQATKKMRTLRLNKNFSIPHDVTAKFNASKITLMPNKGRGLIAGSSARVVLSLAGVKDVTAKFNSGSKNKLNNAKVTMEALANFSIPFERSHKPREAKTEGIRKFVGGRDNKFGGPRKFAPRAPRTEEKPMAENPMDKITL
jgi:small subunit ribosomal protein S5